MLSLAIRALPWAGWLIPLALKFTPLAGLIGGTGVLAGVMTVFSQITGLAVDLVRSLAATRNGVIILCAAVMWTGYKTVDLWHPHPGCPPQVTCPKPVAPVSRKRGSVLPEWVPMP